MNLRTTHIPLLLLVALVPLAVAAGQSVDLGEFRIQVDDLREPRGVVITASGTIYVAEAGADRVSIVNASGRRLGEVGGSDLGLRAPHGLALDDRERLFIADTGNHRIVAVNRAGAMEMAFGGRGDGPGQLEAPRAVALGGGHIWIADTGNDRVQVFDTDGAHLATHGRLGSGIGSFRRPTGIVVADDGAVFVADTGNHRVQRIDVDGTIRAYTEWGAFPGLVAEPNGLAWHDGALYVADGLNHRVQVLDRVGDYIAEWGLHAIVAHDGAGRLHFPSDVAVAPDGSVAAVAEPVEDRIQIFGRRADAGPSGPVAKDNTSDFGHHMSIAGELLAVAEPESRSIAVFDLRRETPILITNFGAAGSRCGQIGRVNGLALDATAYRLLVADDDNDRLAVHAIEFDPGGPPRYDPFLAKFVLARSAASIEPDEKVLRLGAVARDPSGATWLLDTARGRVLRLDGRMRVEAAWGGADVLDQPADIAVSADGATIVVTEPWQRRAIAFDREGRERFVMTDAGGEPLVRPRGVATGPEGSIYVTDDGLDRVVRYGADGAYLGHFGVRGAQVEQLWKPVDVAVAGDGRIFVLDHGNHRIQAFEPDGTWTLSFGLGRAYTPRNRPKPPEEIED